MANEIDFVLDRTDLSDKELDVVIAYERKMMALYESGGKPKKEGAMTGNELATKLGLIPTPEPIKRRY